MGTLTIDLAIYGWWTDRKASRRLPFLLGLFWLLGATLLLWLANSKILLIMSRIMQGVGATVIWCAGLAILVDAVGEKHIGESMGYVAIALNLSTLTAPTLGGVVFARAGENAVFGMACGIIAVDVLLRFSIVERGALTGQTSSRTRQSGLKLRDAESKCYLCVLERMGMPAMQKQITPVSLEKAYGRGSYSCQCSTYGPYSSKLGSLRQWQFPPIVTLLFSWRFTFALWGGFVYATVLAGFQAVLPLRLYDIFGWDSVGGGLIFIPLVAPGLLGPLIGALADRFGHRWVATAGFAALCPALILLRLVQHNTLAQKATLCVLLSVIGLCGTGLLEPLIAEITYLGGKQQGETVGVVKVRSYAQAFALFNVAWEIGDTAGPLLAGFMLDSVGWDAMSLTLGLLAGVSAVTTALWCGGWVFSSQEDTVQTRA